MNLNSLEIEFIYNMTNMVIHLGINSKGETEYVLILKIQMKL